MGYLLLSHPTKNEEVEITYTISGGFAPATQYSPAEYPDVEFDDLPDWADFDDCVEMVLEQETEDALSDGDDRMDYDYDVDYEYDGYDY